MREYLHQLRSDASDSGISAAYGAAVSSIGYRIHTRDIWSSGVYVWKAERQIDCCVGCGHIWMKEEVSIEGAGSVWEMPGSISALLVVYGDSCLTWMEWCLYVAAD
jgi:hypothetical protein